MLRACEGEKVEAEQIVVYKIYTCSVLEYYKGLQAQGF